jgi:hypothetical protein
MATLTAALAHAQTTRPTPQLPATPAAGTALPTRIAVENAPAPLYDDPVWHGASDPVVIWMPGKNNGKGEWWMYYTQRRATLPNPRGVDWVHGSAIGIATSPDGLHWTYGGVAQGSLPATGSTPKRELGDPVASNTTWWAPTVFWEKGTGMSGGGGPGDKLHMFVTLVHGIFTSWTGDRTIEHFTSDDGVNWTYVSSLPLASRRTIDPSCYKINDTWYLWYKNEAAGSHTFMAKSKDLSTWTDKGEIIGGRGHEAPFVWKWKGAYWMINDAHGKGMDVWRSDSGTGNWTLNTNLLGAPDGKRPIDNQVGHHPWIVTQGDPGNEQLVLFYFTHQGNKTYMQMAEITLGDDGKLACDRNKYLATTPPAPATPPK